MQKTSEKIKIKFFQNWILKFKFGKKRFKKYLPVSLETVSNLCKFGARENSYSLQRDCRRKREIRMCIGGGVGCLKVVEKLPTTGKGRVRPCKIRASLGWSHRRRSEVRKRSIVCFWVRPLFKLSMKTYVYACAHACVHTLNESGIVHQWAYVCNTNYMPSESQLYSCIRTHTHSHMHIHSCTCAYTYIGTCERTNTYIPTYVLTYSHIHTCVNIHT